MIPDAATSSSRPKPSADTSTQHALQPPTHIEATVARAGALLHEGRPMEAVDLLERALQRHSHDGRVWTALGLANAAAGRLAQARSQLENALLLLPRQAPALRKEAEAGLQALRRAEASGSVDDAVPLRGIPIG